MKRFILLLSLLLTGTGMVLAQNQTGQIFGQVTDSSGAVIPGVKVTLSGPALIQPQVATSSSAGSYQFPNIPIGMYQVEFQIAGYSPLVRSNIRIDIGFNAQVNAALQIGEVQQTVQVTGGAPVVDTQSTAQSQELDQQALEGLPVARSFFNAVNNSPGVQNPAKDVGGAQNLNQPNFIALGAIPGQNRYFYEGADMGPAGGGNAMWVDYNTVQEMQVQSGGADATVQTSGMAINMVVKSGSNQFHGSFHDFEEGQTFEADNIGKGTPMRNALAATGASPGNPLTHFRDIGADIGGPIKKDKLWFWFNYGSNGIWVGADKIYNSGGNCAAVAANQLAYDYSTVRSCTFAFPTFIRAYAYKIGYSPFHNNTFTLTNEYSVKQVLYNGLTTLVPLESTRPQNSACHDHFHWGGLADIADRPDTLGAKGHTLFWDCGWPVLWKFDDQQILSDRWVLDVAYMHYIKRNQFTLQPPSVSGGTDEYATPIQLERANAAIRHSNIAVTTFQPMQNFKVMSSYNLPAKLGGNHTFKFGYNWYRFENCCTDNAGGQMEEVFSSGSAAPFSVANAAIFYGYGYVDQFLNENNAYIQDTYNRKRWTFNLGVRWDSQSDSEGPFTVPASQYQGQVGRDGSTFNFFPSRAFAGSKGGVTWNTFAPRIGVTYDLLGRGTTVLKASFGQYYDQRTAGQLADTYNTIGKGTGQPSIQFPWTDLNHDGRVQMNEVCLATSAACGTVSPVYANNYPKPGALPNKVDPNIKDPRTNEVTAGVSQQVGQGFGITVTYTYRYFDHFIWNQINNLSSADFTACQTSPTAGVPCSYTNGATGLPTSTTLAATTCPTTTAPTYATQCVPVTYYVSNKTLPTDYTVTNQPDYHRTYQGVSVVVRKQLSRHWSLDGNGTIQSNRQFWTAPDSYQDRTNIDPQNGAQYSPTASPGGGFPVQIAVNARWNMKLGGTYKLPWWGIGIAAITDISQGYPYLSAISIGSRPNGNAATAVFVAHPGDQRLANVQNTNLRVDKTFTFKDRIKAQGSLDWYNITNSNTILGMQPNQNNAQANYIQYILSPSLLRLGIKVSF